MNSELDFKYATSETDLTEWKFVKSSRKLSTETVKV